ncbi:hypothetical protein ONZ51_g5636 [Trametes cubensis]|uniref:Cytochrome P450 n=1 Tax=Trametes cubensis TaxID=1111947 RepID=A0AAD7XAT3_9APHY|nr:hypothetical protein ONZ51_g5636 [Trametes cubensis]
MLSVSQLLGCVLAVALSICWRSIINVYASPLRTLLGPPSPSLFYGNARQVCQASSNVRTTRLWTQKYGSNIFCRWLFMIPCLWTADPVAIRHILHSGSYGKPWEARISAARVAGDSVLVAEGEATLLWCSLTLTASSFTEGEKHHGQRTILNPAFGPAQIRQLMDIFLDKSAELRDIWLDEITASGGSVRMDVVDPLKKMTLDVIGLACFGYHLEALNARGSPNELNQAFYRIFLATPPISILRIIKDYLPFLDLFPNKRTMAIRDARATMRRIGTQLIEEKKAAIMRERSDSSGQLDKKDLPGKDLLTLLIKANMATNLPENQRLSDEEVLSLAGHETTSTAAAWCLFALTQSPRVQDKLREELLGLGTDSPTMDDIASLPYLEWVIRETLRLHAPVAFTLRTALKDDVIPVSEPIVDRNGNTQHEIRIAKGNRAIFSILAVHHSTSIWGDDALEFRPERWENPPEALSTIPGVWGHLLTFAGGPHACIGYRFSIAELKVLLFTLVRAFEFELAVDPADITCVGMFTRRPAVDGELNKGTQLPLLVRPYVAS